MATPALAMASGSNYEEDIDMAKRRKPTGHSARNGNAPSPYLKYGKMPYRYSWEQRVSDGNLKQAANQSLTNKYR